MIIGFPLSFMGPIPEEALAIAELFVRLTRKFQPDARLVQMTDIETPGIHGVKCSRTPRIGDLGVWWFEASIAFPEKEYLRADYDLVIRGDVSDVFTHPFDMAIAKETNDVMNNGVVFIRDRDILKDALGFYHNATSHDGWQDVQKAMTMAIDCGKYRVKKLDRDIYNFIYKQTKVPDTARIIHYKGWRKKLMLAQWSGVQ